MIPLAREFRKCSRECELAAICDKRDKNSERILEAAERSIQDEGRFVEVERD